MDPRWRGTEETQPQQTKRVCSAQLIRIGSHATPALVPRSQEQMTTWLSRSKGVRDFSLSRFVRATLVCFLSRLLACVSSPSVISRTALFVGAICTHRSCRRLVESAALASSPGSADLRVHLLTPGPYPSDAPSVSPNLTSPVVLLVELHFPPHKMGVRPRLPLP